MFWKTEYIKMVTIISLNELYKKDCTIGEAIVYQNNNESKFYLCKIT